jgi:hypothetical protein
MSLTMLALIGGALALIVLGRISVAISRADDARNAWLAAGGQSADRSGSTTTVIVKVDHLTVNVQHNTVAQLFGQLVGRSPEQPVVLGQYTGPGQRRTPAALPAAPTRALPAAPVAAPAAEVHPVTEQTVPLALPAAAPVGRPASPLAVFAQPTRPESTRAEDRIRVR